MARALTYVAGAAAALLPLLRWYCCLEEEGTITDSVNTRELALGVLMEVTEGGSYSHLVLRSVLEKHQYLTKQRRGVLARLAEGTIQRMLELDYILDRFSKVKVKKMKPVIRNILRLGVYQLKYMDAVPASAACNEAVKLAKKKGFASLGGFVNGVLRSVGRDLGQILIPMKRGSRSKRCLCAIRFRNG